MDRRGIALIFSLLVVMVLSILAASFFLRSINENNLVRRYVNSTRAFWLAEAGIAEGIISLPNNTAGCLQTNYCYSVTATYISGLYYQINSTGTVTLPTGGSVSRTLSAVVETDEANPSGFPYAIETTVDLEIRGSVDINPDGSMREESALDFPDLFNYTKEEMKSFATYLYTNPENNISPCDGITWIELSPGSEFKVSSSGWQGSGILIVNGDAQITGGQFSGIIYVIGKLRVSGNPVITGSILAESDTELVEDTTITGNVTLNYDADAISDALVPLQFISPEIVSWRETQ